MGKARRVEWRGWSRLGGGIEFVGVRVGVSSVSAGVPVTEPQPRINKITTQKGPGDIQQPLPTGV